VTPEGKVQSDIVKYAKSKGFWPLRFEVMQMSGFPDLMLLGHGVVLFIEVKRKEDEVGPKGLQAHRLIQISNHGIPAKWFGNLEDAKEFIDEFEPEQSP
jgi:hypothetical protein